MMQDNDFYLTLPSNASSNLFPSNSKSHYRVALPRQIRLKEEEDWEVGLHHAVYPLSWFDIPRECTHSHIMLHHSDDFKVCTLPEGMYRTALEVMEGLLRCLKEFDPLPTSTVEVDNEWNVTFKSQDEWVAITVPVAQTLGWLTREKTTRPGVQISGSFTTSHKHGYEWCVILPQTTVSFPGSFIIQPPTSLCPCKHKIVQVLTNLVEPWQVGDQRLPLLHEMVPYGKFRETILEEKERCHYLPLRTKTFQTVEIYLTNGIGQLLSFLDGTVNVVLHFRRRTP